ncbi:hypothetical protein PRZ48_007260 [Zasmidium cellare]|uniref:SMP-30/Gluconolactonase/LRE-like region domain-containing protein n=1 Tax=Zasmidium cellare TaxID=395010 RepID=A0ABR0EIU9_ZASCE|nr:hypothetical protein PRZ48_007260 [Zasmidium cellare]
MTLLRSIAISLLITSAASHRPNPSDESNCRPEGRVRLLYQYPAGTFVENIAVRSNGKLLLTLLDRPHLDQIDPFDDIPQAETIVQFPQARSVSGIAEIAHDVFATTVGNFSFDDPNVSPGTWSVWHTSFPTSKRESRKVKVRRITDLPGINFPNGMSNLPETATPNDILVGDVFTGKIWRVESRTGEKEVVIENNLTAVVPDPLYGEAGVNGLLVRGNTLYFANTGLGILARQQITSDGRPAGEPQVVARLTSPQQADDFDIRGGYGYLATGSGNAIVRTCLEHCEPGVQSEAIAGGLNSTEVAEPTSVAFGRTRKDRHILYVVTGGGRVTPVNGNVTIGAQVLAVDTRGWE